MTRGMLIRDVKQMGAGTVDIEIREGVIATIGPRLKPSSDELETIDGGGRLLFPGFVDAHAHLDKSLLGLGWYRNEVGPGLTDKIDNERRMRVEQNIDIHEQSSRSARRSVAAGTTRMRTFVDIDTDVKLSCFDGVLRTREDLRDALDLQIVAFPQSGMLIRPGTTDLMEDALRNGADLVGGLDPSAIDRDPRGHLDAIFGMAERYDVDIDIHLHEPGELGAFSIELIAERVKTLGWQGRTVISHAFCLGGVDESYLKSLIELLVENDIAIMSHGPSGLRSAPPVKRLSDAGVRLCTGNDGVRDSWGPLNMPDMLLRCFIVAYRNNLRRDDEIEMAIDIATGAGAGVIGMEGYGLEPGCSADLVLVDGETHVEAVIERPSRWLVVKGGRIVARDGKCLV